jgi:hydrogenase maturation protein HypF
MAENQVKGPVLGVSWDGTGLGADGTIWGGEFLLVDDPRRELPAEAPFIRFAHFRNFRLPGGEAAIRQPRRAALGLLWEIYGESLFDREDTAAVRRQFSAPELSMMRKMLAGTVNAPLTSSAGRLFDGVAAILGLCQRSHFEGQAAMELEFAIQPGVEAGCHFKVEEARKTIVDWRQLVQDMLEGAQKGVSIGRLAAEFHNTLAEIIVAIARQATTPQVALTGGCFQNRYLLERTVRRLQEEDFRPFWHQRIPPNDGGVAVGQVIGAARALAARGEAKEAICV